MAETAEVEKTETEKVTETTKASETGSTKQLSQADVDAIVQDRLARERKKYADYDDLKSKATKFDEQAAANLSDLEKERQAREKAEARSCLLVELRRLGLQVRHSRRTSSVPRARRSWTMASTSA